MSEAANKSGAAEQAEEKSYYRIFPAWLNRIVYFICRNSVWIAAKLLFRLETRGYGNIPDTGAVMVVCNHSSHMDPPLCSTAARRHLHFLAKAELFSGPGLGYLVSMLGAFPVRRGEGDRAAIRTCINILKEGKALLIFPEGTRSPDGEMQEPKTGVAMILSQLPETLIVPVRIDGSYDAWGRNGKKIQRTKVRMTIGQGFRVADLGLQNMGKKQLYHEMGKEIMRKIVTATP